MAVVFFCHHMDQSAAQTRHSQRLPTVKAGQNGRAEPSESG